MKRLTSLMLSTTLMAGALSAITATPALACGSSLQRADGFRAMKIGESLDAGVISVSGGLEYVSLLTFNLELGKTKREYEIGDTVTINITVTRPAKEDPLGNGIPMDRPYVEPAEGVTVGVGLSIGRVFLPGAAISNADGLARVKIKLEDYAPPNKTVDASIYAWKIVQQTPCLTVQEYGFTTRPGMFRTAP